jgi:protein ImuA
LALHTRPLGAGFDLPPLSLGVAELDRVLGGGLQLDALHEVNCVEERDAAAATGFATGLLTLVLVRSKKSALWVRHKFATLEDGAPFGPGLAAFGLDPSRILFALAETTRQMLDTMELALRSGAVATVLGELRGGSKIDLHVTRRLSLAAGRGGTPGLLLRLGASKRSLAVPVSAATRWRIAPLPSDLSLARSIGMPSFQADLVRNRRGPAARFLLEWRVHERTPGFHPALREHLAAPSPYRSDSAWASERSRVSA